VTEPPQIAAFDFDGTLTSGGSVWQFLIAIVGPWRVASAGFRIVVKLGLAALFGNGAADEAKEALFRRTLRGLRADEVLLQSTRFGIEHYRHKARADVRARLEWHRSQGHVLVIVSASPDLYVRAAGAELDVDKVIATKLEVRDDGLLTGCYDGKNCRGAEKLERLEQWMRTSVVAQHVGEGTDTSRAEARNQKPFLWAYGNSAGDERLLDAADVGVDAGRLGRFGRLRRFTRLADLEGS